MSNLDLVYPKFMKAIGYVRLGHLPTQACRLAECTWSSMRKALDANPELADMFADALQECFDNMAESLVLIDSDSAQHVYGSKDPKMAKVISDNIKWLLERYKPEKYGTRVKVETTSADSVIIAALDAAKQAINRIPIPAPGDGARVIEGSVLPPPPLSASLPVIDLVGVDPEIADLIA